MAAVISHTVRAVATCEASRSTHSKQASRSTHSSRSAKSAVARKVSAAGTPTAAAFISQSTAFSAKFTPRQSRHAGRSAVRCACAASADTLAGCKEACAALVKSANCAPILVRLAWHDSGNYDAEVGTGGANGSIRFDLEQTHGGNAGLKNALNLLKPIKKKFPEVGYADLFQMASATAIEVAGGPQIDMRYGRIDAVDESEVPTDGRLPSPGAPYQEATGAEPAKESKDQTATGHLRRVFGRMGLSDEDIVALSGAHTLGRTFKDRSGAAPLAETKYTKDGPGTKGGQSWTEDWLKFNNRYFTMLLEAEKGTSDPELLQLATDNALLTDPSFRPHVEKYAADSDAFFTAYAAAQKRLSECGSKFA